MKKDVLTYKEFIGTVHFSTDDEIFFGKIQGIYDLVIFEGNSVTSLKKAFKEAVDEQYYVNKSKKIHLKVKKARLMCV